MLDFELSSIIGNKLPRIVLLSVRMLNSTNEMVRNKFNRALEELYKRH